MRYALLFLLATIVSACGFTPIYKKADGAHVPDATANIYIPPVTNFDGPHGVELRNELMAMLTPRGRPVQAEYVLNISMTQPRIAGYTLRPDGTESSYMVSIDADYTLSSMSAAGNIEIRRARVGAMQPYTILKDQYSTEMLKDEAIRLVIKNIANQIRIGVITAIAGRQ